MKTTQLGRLGREISVVGLGGEGVLRTYDRDREAQSVIHEALQQGITYCDCARVYSDSELYYGAVWKKNPALRSSIFQTSKSASRDRAGALHDLSVSLQRLGTEYLDLWQIHDLRTEEDFAKGVAVIGMKVMGAGHYIVPELGITAQLLIRYALSCGITLAIVGCSSPQEVRALSAAADLPLLSDPEKEKITELFAPHARELAFYRGVR